MTNKDGGNDIVYDKDGNIILCPDLYKLNPDKYFVNKSKPKTD